MSDRYPANKPLALTVWFNRVVQQIRTPFQSALVLMCYISLSLIYFGDAVYSEILGCRGWIALWRHICLCHAAVYGEVGSVDEAALI